jgi:eukaryotic-like serine/threonine-protein kinase
VTKFPFALPPRYVPTAERIQGGQGSIYVCEDSYLGRQVAIKVMHIKAEAKDLRKELKVLCELRSRHIAEVYDLVFSRGGNLGLVQEFVPGPTLQEYAKGSVMDNDQLLRILYQISCGLSDVHGSHKAHCDIKPDNLKFDAEKIVKILDFGFAREAAEEGETTKGRGTYGYQGPEFFQHPPIRFSESSDVYAFGATAWAIANRGKLHASLLETPPQSRTKLPSFAASRADLPGEVANVLDATLKPDPKTRPPINEVRDTIERRLLFGKHRAVISSTHQLSEAGKSVVLNVGPASIKISYDGLRFAVSEISGDVYINNIPAANCPRLPHSCVVTIGGHHLGAQREFITIDTSHPEVIP